MANAGTNAVRLLLRGIRERKLIKVFAALDAIQPPVAVLGAFCISVAALSVVMSGTHLRADLGTAPLALFFLYGLIVVALGRKDGIKARTVLWAPVYVAWRLLAFVLAFSVRDRLNFFVRRNKGTET